MEGKLSEGVKGATIRAQNLNGCVNTQWRGSAERAAGRGMRGYQENRACEGALGLRGRKPIC